MKPTFEEITETTKFSAGELEGAQRIGITNPTELKKFIGQSFCIDLVFNLSSKERVDLFIRMLEDMVKRDQDPDQVAPYLLGVHDLYKIEEFGIHNGNIMVVGQRTVPNDNNKKIKFGAPFETVVILAKLNGERIISDNTKIKSITDSLHSFYEIMENRPSEIEDVLEKKDVIERIVDSLNQPIDPLNLKKQTKESVIEELLQQMDKQVVEESGLPLGLYNPKKMMGSAVKLKIRVGRF